MADALITRDGPVGAPLDYTIPASSELVPVSVSATFIDPSNAGPYIPVLEVITPSGNVIGPFPLSEVIAAGASARVSWFPGLAGNTDAPGIWYVVQPVAPATAPALSTPGASFLNGWQNAALPDGTYSPLRYRLDPATNMLRIVGAITNGALGSAAFVLPAAFRPATDVVMVISSVDGSDALACSVSAATGAVTPLAGASTGGTPSGSAGGDLAGSYPNPTVAALEETSGPTRLAVAAITDGQYLLRSGATIISGTPAGSSPLTTKGDLFGHSTVDARIPVGLNGQALLADSAQALGVKWGSLPSGAGGVLAVAKYAPAALATYNITNTAGLVAVDTTNLTVAFTVPASGNAVVTFSAAMAGPGGNVLGLGLLNHSGGAQIGETLSNIISGTALTTLTLVWYLTGLTPGAALQLDLAAGIGTGGVGATGKLFAQGKTGNGGNFNSITGPAVIVVESA